jgi:hypothetical protein
MKMIALDDVAHKRLNAWKPTPEESFAHSSKSPGLPWIVL